MSKPDTKVEFKTLIGKTFTEITKSTEELIFKNETEGYVLVHMQDCCEYVYIEDIDNDIQLLVGAEILEAEESSHDGDEDKLCGDSCTWTFFKIRTQRDSFTIRFFGESNGYYSESAELYKLKDES
jgi:hypothetical protein